jgi:hypothetical protein
VHIYDAWKCDWMFTPLNMRQLAQLPLYKGGLEDLPPNSLATIGFAVNEYASSQLQGTSMSSFNVLFVILIGDVDCPLLDELAVAMQRNK